MMSSHINNPKISVYIPTHNRFDMLQRAVYSVLTQDYSNVEVIICDDGSTDGTFDRVSAVFQNDSRVKIIRNNVPMGANVARNRAIAEATGDFVTGLDDDDFFMPTRLSTFISNYNPSYAFMFAGILNCRREKNRRFDSWTGVLPLSKLLNRNYVGNQVFVKRQHMLDIGGFDETLPAWQDYDCWVRLQKRFGASKGLPQLTYVLDTSHESPRITTSNKVEAAREKFIKKHIDIMSKYNKKVHASDYILMTKNRISIFDFLKHVNRVYLKKFIYRTFFEKH